MARSNDPSLIPALMEALAYDPATGRFTWKRRPLHHFKSERDCNRWNATYAGRPAFAGINSQGYHDGTFTDVKLRAHRVAWALHYGCWPSDQIDHINHDRADNRIGNLRDVPRELNAINRKMSVRNSSGFTGVKRNNRGCWTASITYRNKGIALGDFASLDDAVRARKEAERGLGFHENHGRAAGVAR